MLQSLELTRFLQVNRNPLRSKALWSVSSIPWNQETLQARSALAQSQPWRQVSLGAKSAYKTRLLAFKVLTPVSCTVKSATPLPSVSPCSRPSAKRSSPAVPEKAVEPT